MAHKTCYITKVDATADPYLTDMHKVLDKQKHESLQLICLQHDSTTHLASHICPFVAVPRSSTTIPPRRISPLPFFLPRLHNLLGNPHIFAPSTDYQVSVVPPLFKGCLFACCLVYCPSNITRPPPEPRLKYKIYGISKSPQRSSKQYTRLMTLGDAGWFTPSQRSSTPPL